MMAEIKKRQVKLLNELSEKGRFLSTIMVKLSSLRVILEDSSSMGGKIMRVNITLECTSCKERNYLTSKNKRNNPDRLEKQKYCPRERKVTLHRETK